MAGVTDIPHFALPFRFEGGRAVVVQQDSIDDVATCVEVILRYRQGDRVDLPEFGIPDPTFTEGPIDLAAIERAVEKWEERADVLITEDPDRFDELVRHVLVEVRGAQDA